jgi:hypothetical protein
VAPDDEVSHQYVPGVERWLLTALMRELWVAQSVVADCWQWGIFSAQMAFLLNLHFGNK